MLNSFDLVAKRYAETKPLRGARAALDIRPIGQRRYWWNRIAKVNDNCYALLDGSMWWSNLPSNFEDMAPIVWERKPDGDYLTIRNNINDNISVSRYTFLQRYLPSTMEFHYDNGKHYVNYKGVDYYLPKPKAEIDWGNKYFKLTADHKIVFKDINPDGFVRMNELQPFKTRRVDKELSKHYKPKIKEFWDWMQVVMPVLGEIFQYLIFLCYILLS